MPASSGIRLGRLVHEECLAAIEALDSDQNVHLRIHQARKAIRRARSKPGSASTPAAAA